MFSIFDCETRKRVSDESYATAAEAYRDYYMNDGHTFVGVIQQEAAPMQMTVAQLLEALKNAPPEAKVVFQGNIEGEEDKPGDEPSYTTCLGHVYSAFYRDSVPEFVIDGAITESEN